VELLDIAPTLLELAGAPIPKPFEGRSLLADVREVPAVFEHPLYQQQTAENRPRVRAALRSVAGDPVRPLLFDQLEIGARTSEWKLLASSNGDELFDLRTDPGERHNLADSRRDVRQSLRTAIQRWAEGHPINIRNEDSINKDLRETLRALGYIR
jgi:arylsulfatase A-like enzyme